MSDALAGCGRCGKLIRQRDAETCWYCNGWLCIACWDACGHCGHARADALQAKIAADYAAQAVRQEKQR